MYFIVFKTKMQGFYAFLQPHLHAVGVQVLLQFPDAQQLLVEDARCQPGVDALVVEQLQKILFFARAAAGNDGDIHPGSHRVQHFKVEAVAHAVGVDAVQADLARAVGGAPADPVQRIPAGILAPALGEHPNCPFTRFTSAESTTHWSP